MAINRPVLGVSAFVVDNGKVLLVKRGHEPLKGFWSLPGGHVEGGETLADAAAREVREETGIKVTGLRRIDIVEIIGHTGAGGVERHFVLVVFAALRAGGSLAAADDAADARWVDVDEVAGLMMTEDTKATIARHVAEVQHG